MRRYEVVFVLAPTLTEEEAEQTVDGFTKTAAEKGAKVLKVDHWGRRRLAFPVKNHHEGLYVILTLEESSVVAVAELERRFKVTDSVIRFLSVRTDLDAKRAEKFRTRRETRKRRRAEVTSLKDSQQEAETVAKNED
jgi:small subunit ribosomal protein S6